jgi:hypothetical protein
LARFLAWKAGLPDFSWYNIPKQRKYTQRPQNIPNASYSFGVAVG